MSDLDHVLWLGGSPRGGKTTLSLLLAGTYDLKIYNLDWHHVREHRTRGGPAMRWWDERTPDERWLAPREDELLARSVAAWEEGFALVLEDLRALPRSRPILAEGPGALPWRVAPLLSSPRQALWLVPTAEFRDEVARRRYGPAMGSFEGASDPARAARNMRARDLALGRRVRESCRDLGLTWVEVDGSRDVDASLSLLEEHFRPHLPAPANLS